VETPTVFLGLVEEHEDLSGSGSDFVVVLPALAPPPISLETPVQVNGGHTLPTVVPYKRTWISIFSSSDFDRLGRGSFDGGGLYDCSLSESFLNGAHKQLNRVLLRKALGSKQPQLLALDMEWMEWK
jgi:hypothetical protein